jgi:rubrerythrin
MNIFEFAMDKEKLSEDYYRKLAGTCGNQGIKNICSTLAEDEHKHFEMIEKMKEKGQPQLTETKALGNAKEIFEQMREERESISCDISEVELFKKAQEFEKESEDFYTQKANETSDMFQRDLFLKMAKEEHKHYIVLENIIQLLQRPERWLENAEWYHLEEY